MKDVFRKIRWAYQRVVRGYDDTAYWNLDYYIARIALPVLKSYKTDKMGFMSNHEYEGDNPMDEGWHTEESQNELFDKMIFAMNSIVEDDMDMDDPVAYEEKINDGCRLFGEYFRGLWD